MKCRACVPTALISAVLVAAPVVRAATIVGEATDGTVNGQNDFVGDGGGVVSATTDNESNRLRVGGGGTATNNQNIAGVFVFDLPPLGPGETFATASFGVHLVVKDGTAIPSADVYALGLRSTNTLDAGDFYVGAFAGDATDATALTQAFLTQNSTAPGFHTTSGVAGANSMTLVSFLNAAYAGDPTASDKFLFIRLNPDSNPSGTSNRFRLASAESATASERPRLDYTTVPEPGFLSIAAAGFLVLRRRTRQVGIASATR